MDELYREEILDHYKNPRNFGSIEKAVEGELIHLHASNHGCGDDVDADLVIDNGKIVEIRWRGRGCAISQASMSMVSDWVIGKKVTDVKRLGKDRILEFMGIPEIADAREKCALIPVQIFASMA